MAKAMVKKMQPKLCYQLACDSQCQVELWQHGVDNFSVHYGQQIHCSLTYNEACTELGAAIMHRQACAGLLDNREKGER